VGACPDFSRENLTASDFTLVIGIGLLVSAMPFRLLVKYMLHLSASHLALAAGLPSEIRLAILEAKVYGCPFAIFLLPSRATFA